MDDAPVWTGKGRDGAWNCPAVDCQHFQPHLDSLKNNLKYIIDS